MIKENIIKGIELAEDILKNSPYETQKNEIIKLFEKTKNNNLTDILLRLIVIDSCYSTNMNRRLFGFEELSKFILNELEPKIELLSDVYLFIKKNFNLLITPIGIDKKGKLKGHAFSIITKYLYFRTKFNFPIFDSLVLKELHYQANLKKSPEPSLDYFEQLKKWKDKYKLSWDKLDQYFWVCGKVRKGGFSLLLKDKKNYLNLLKDLNLDLNGKIKSEKVDKLIKEKLTFVKIQFKEEKIRKIHNLFLILEAEKN